MLRNIEAKCRVELVETCFFAEIAFDILRLTSFSDSLRNNRLVKQTVLQIFVCIIFNYTLVKVS